MVIGLLLRGHGIARMLQPHLSIQFRFQLCVRCFLSFLNSSLELLNAIPVNTAPFQDSADVTI